MRCPCDKKYKELEQTVKRLLAQNKTLLKRFHNIQDEHESDKKALDNRIKLLERSDTDFGSSSAKIPRIEASEKIIIKSESSEDFEELSARCERLESDFDCLNKANTQQTTHFQRANQELKVEMNEVKEKLEFEIQSLKEH